MRDKKTLTLARRPRAPLVSTKKTKRPGSSPLPSMPALETVSLPDFPSFAESPDILDDQHILALHQKLECHFQSCHRISRNLFPAVTHQERLSGLAASQRRRGAAGSEPCGDHAVCETPPRLSAFLHLLMPWLREPDARPSRSTASRHLQTTG